MLPINQRWSAIVQVVGSSLEIRPRPTWTNLHHGAATKHKHVKKTKRNSPWYVVKSIPTRPVTTIFAINCGSLDYGSVFQWSMMQLLEREPCLHRLHQSLAWRMASLTLSDQATWLQKLHLFLEPNHSTLEICNQKPSSCMPTYWSIMNHHQHRSQHPWPSTIRLPAIATANPSAPSKGRGTQTMALPKFDNCVQSNNFKSESENETLD